MTSPRTTLDREALMAQVEQLEAERDRLRQTVVGLSSLVAMAHAAGFVTAVAVPPPAAPAHGRGRPVSDLEMAQNGGRPFISSP